MWWLSRMVEDTGCPSLSLCALFPCDRASMEHAVHRLASLDGQWIPGICMLLSLQGWRYKWVSPCPAETQTWALVLKRFTARTLPLSHSNRNPFKNLNYKLFGKNIRKQSWGKFAIYHLFSFVYQASIYRMPMQRWRLQEPTRVGSPTVCAQELKWLSA